MSSLNVGFRVKSQDEVLDQFLNFKVFVRKFGLLGTLSIQGYFNGFQRDCGNDIGKSFQGFHLRFRVFFTIFWS